MSTKTNVYEISPRSENQLMTLIHLMEMQNLDTKDIELTDWELLTVRLSLDYNVEHRAKFKRAYVSAIYKSENTYTTLGLANTDFEICEFPRFLDIIELVKKLQQ